MARSPVGAQHSLTILAVHDLNRAVRFYKDAFGWPVRTEEDGFVEFELPDGCGFGLHDRPTFAEGAKQMPERALSGRLTGTELYFYCEDLEDAVARLEAIGARSLSPLQKRRWGDHAAYFADPAGNVIVLAKLQGEDE